jgi:hypothetical protein
LKLTASSSFWPASSSRVDRRQSAAEIAGRGQGCDLGYPGARVAVNGRRTTAGHHVGDRRHRHRGAIGENDPQGLDPRRQRAKPFAGAKPDIDPFLAVAELADHIAADFGAHGDADVLGRDSESGGPLAVELDQDLGIAGLRGGGDIADLGQVLERPPHLFGGAVELQEVIREDLNRDRGAHRQHRRPHELGLGARKAGDGGAHALHRRRFVLGVGLARHPEVDLREIFAQGPATGCGRRQAADHGKYRCEGRVGDQHLLDPVDGLGGGLERRALWQPELKGELALSQIRHEVGAEAWNDQNRSGKEGDRDGENHPPPLQRLGESSGIGAAETVEEPAQWCGCDLENAAKCPPSEADQQRREQQ